MFLLSWVRIIFYLLRLEVIGDDSIRFTMLDFVRLNEAAPLLVVSMAGTTKFLFAFMSVTSVSTVLVYVPYNTTF